MNNISLFKVHNIPNIGEEIQKVWDSGNITEGEITEKFEIKFADFISNENTVLLNSGTSALTMAYRLLNLQPGDEVISSPMTCAATNEPILSTGAKIVWADIDKNGNILEESIKKKITNKTKAIVGVCWGGIPFNIDKILSFSNDIPIIVDAAHALGAKYNNKIIGSKQENVITCFSFQAIKHLTTGDGGAITLPNNSMADRARKLRWFGISRKYHGSKWEQDILEYGYKFHMNNINAVIGIMQMEHISYIIKRHIENADFYQKNIINPLIIKPKINNNMKPSWWLYTIKTKNRERFKKYLQEKGISSDVVHKRNDIYTCFKDFRPEEYFTGVTNFDDTHLCIPVGWWVSNTEREYIVKCINSYEK